MNITCDLILLVIFICGANSHSFRNVSLFVHERYGDKFNVTIDGDIERPIFNGKTITEVYVREQKVTELKRDAVRNMVRLTTISFYKSNINNIQPGAFRNLPRFHTLSFTYENITKIRKGIFNNLLLKHLRISNTPLRTIEDEAFGYMSNLTSIIVDRNNLTVWKSNWFKNSSYVEVLNFQFNSIKVIPEMAFAELPRLNQIHFENNQICDIGAGAFDGLYYLDYVGLRFNRLKILNQNVFPHKVVIGSLSIDANKFNYLPQNIFNKLEVSFLTLVPNPWLCPCLERINYWLLQTNGSTTNSIYCTGSDVPVCVTSKAFSRTCLELADEEATKTYFRLVKSLKSRLDQNCVQFN